MSIKTKFRELFRRVKNKPILSEPVKEKEEIDTDSLIEHEKTEIDKYSDFLKDLGDNFEQKRAVVSDFNRILVLAGAGSGKTKVLTKKFIHLVKDKDVRIEKILAVTFTREAANEMRKRISSALNMKDESLKKNVRTFHSFCLSVLRQNEQFDVIDDKFQRDWIENIISNFREDEKIMQSMYDYLKDNILEWVKDKDNKNQVKEKPKPFGQRRIETKAGIPVRSKSERDIANYLTSLGLNWEYEKPVDWADSSFRPDFTVEGKIYIEHWCYNEKTPEFNKINKQTYLEHRKWKEEQFNKHGKKLISIEEEEMLDLQKLQVRLKSELEEKLNRKLTEKQILDFLDHSNLFPQYRKAYNKFVDEIIEIINLIKSELLELEDVKNIIKDEKKGKVVNFYNVLIPVMERYEEFLKSKDFGKKDFNDLIKDAVNLLKNNKQRRDYYKKKLKYILVDEFQDVSKGQVELLKLLVDQDSYLFAVGDDWQSIYGWRGSRVKYILDFDKEFGPNEKIVLPINYRSTKNIVDASSHFIQLSDYQYKKDISCCKEKDKSYPKILQVNAKNDWDGARYVVNKVNVLKQEDATLRHSDFLVLCRSSRISGRYKEEFKNQNFPIPIRTIHFSKGTEYKYVFVLGLKDGIYGFPNVYVDKDIKRMILDIPIEEKAEEERRLFYVAMTRAKDRLFLISESDNESEFVKDIPKKYKYVYPSEKT